MEKLIVLRERLSKIGIDVEFAANYPWMYLNKINGQTVKERYQGEHGFTVGFVPIRSGESFRFTDLSVVFKLIREYTENKK